MWQEVFLLALLLGLLAACTPTVSSRRREAPLVFAAGSKGLIDATLQAVTPACVREPSGEAQRFMAVEADRETGLTTALNGWVSPHFIEVRKAFTDDSSHFTSGVHCDLPPRSVPAHALTLVLRPVGNTQPSVLGSTSTHTGSEFRVANRFMMQGVDERLEQFELVAP